MKKIILFSILILFVFCSALIAQQRPSGIKLLVKDKETGLAFINDSIMVSTDDTLPAVLVSDANGYIYLNRPPGKYTVLVRRKYYQGQAVSGIIVGEQKTAYLTVELGSGEFKQVKQKKEKRKKQKKGGVKLKMVKE